ncbi:MAG: glycosyltransferase family 39 protein [Draconibacterium sp.]|nr:glycosyltransferase family 39 protein [Draconibacterium sp.]
MESNKIEKRLLYFFLSTLILLQLLLLIFNEKAFGGADSISHFQIARFAFKYPRLFLDHWGKPVYTTLSASFALFGFKSAQVFNLVVAVLTLIFVFKISKLIFPSGAIFTVVLTAFAPIYFLLMITCLTEVLFSFTLIFSVYLFMKNRFIFSAIVLSFIPFVRMEGIVLMPVFALAFLLKRSYFSILFLSVGTLFYSIVGYFAFNDFLWIINRFPYPKGESVYGSGELFHFIKKSNYIFGIPFLLVLVPGLISWTVEILKKFKIRNENFILFIVITGSWLTYFAAHSFVWWKGMGGSLGLIRVMGGVIPLAALTGVKGIQFLFERINKGNLVFAILSFIAVAQIFLFFNQNHLPLKAGRIDKLIIKSADFLKQKGQNEKIYYFNPELIFHLNLDPYDKTKSNWGIGDKLQPSNSMDFGDILIWDAHFGPNEGRVSFESIENDSHLQKIKSFFPVQKIKVLGGYDYAIHIYKKVKNRKAISGSDTFLRELEINPAKSKQVISIDGENVFELQNSSEYSPSIVVYVDELLQKEIFKAELQIQYKSDETIKNKDVLLVISVENGKENLRYEVQPLEWNVDDKEWKTVSVHTRFPANIPKSAIVKMYVWNRNNRHMFIKKLHSKITSY